MLHVKAVREGDNKEMSDADTVTNGKPTTVHVGPEIICDNVDTINTKSTYICFSCNKKSPIILMISNTFSFVFGTLLDSVCCCISSISQRALITLVLTVAVVGTITGGLVGRFKIKTFCRYFLYTGMKGFDGAFLMDLA